MLSRTLRWSVQWMVQTLVDGLGQSELVGEHVDGSDTSVNDGPMPVRDIAANGPTGEDGSKRDGVACVVESSLDSGLAYAEWVSLEILGEVWCGMRLHPPTPETVEDFELFGDYVERTAWDHAWFRTCCSSSIPAIEESSPGRF